MSKKRKSSLEAGLNEISITNLLYEILKKSQDSHQDQKRSKERCNVKVKITIRQKYLKVAKRNHSNQDYSNQTKKKLY